MKYLKTLFVTVLLAATLQFANAKPLASVALPIHTMVSVSVSAAAPQPPYHRRYRRHYRRYYRRHHRRLHIALPPPPPRPPLPPRP